MSTTPNTLQVDITGDNTGLMASLGKAAEGIKGFAKEGGTSIAGMENPLHSITDAFGSFKGVAMGVMGVVAGVAVALGAMYKVGSDAVEETEHFAESMESLHRVMGGTVQQSGELAMALKREGIETDAYVGMVMKSVKGMEKLIDKHPELRKELTETNGQAKSLADIQTVLTDRYLNAAPGIDRARIALEQWGRGGAEAIRINVKVAEAQEDNRKVLKDLGLDYEKIQVQHVAYEQAEKRLAAVHEAQSLMIGTVLMPIWTDFKLSLGETASSVMPNIIGAFQGFATAIIIVVGTIKEVFLSVKLVIEGLINILVPVIQAAFQAIQGNYGDAWKTLKAGGLDAYSELKKGLKDIGDTATKTGEAVANIWSPKETKAGDMKAGGGDLTGAGKDKESVLEAVRARLEKEKSLYEMSGLYELDAHGIVLKKKAEADQINRTYTKEMEAKFLADELAKFDGTEKDKQKLTTMRFAADREVMKQDWAAKLVRFDNEIKAQTQSNQEAIRLAKDKAEKILAYEGGNKQSADYQKARGEVQALEKKAADHIRDINIAKDEIILESMIAEKDAEIRVINNHVAMGNMSELNGLKNVQAVEDRKYNIQRAALEKRLALRKREGDQGQKEAVKIEADLSKLAAASSAKQIETENKKNMIIRNGWNALFAGVKQQMNQSSQGMILGTTTLSGAMKNIWGSMKAAFAQMAADQLMIWIGLEKAKTAASGESALQIFAIETWASVKKVALWIWEGLKYVAIQAWKAASGAYQAIVGIPYVGPFLAPIAAAVALAAVMAMVKNISSARKGFDIQPGDNPITQLHEKEMVLPEEHADTIRNLKDGGGLTDTTRAILASNNAIMQTMARSQSSVDKYNAAPGPKTAARRGGGGANITVNGFVGSERALANTINNLLNKDARVYGSAGR